MTAIDESLDVATMADHWDQLVAVAMLGTDRRNPPDPPAPIADLVDDTVRERPSGRMLAQVAAAVATRRAGVLPAPRVASLVTPAPDDRPVIVPAAAERWYRITTSWPVLEDEWMLAVGASGRRLPPDLLPDVLFRHRSDAVRFARVIAIGGPLATWLATQLPELAGRAGAPVDPSSIWELAELPIPTDLAVYLTAPGSSTGAAIAGAIERGELAHAHRAVLINVVARMHPDALADLQVTLDAFDPVAPGAALASTLADLAGTRRALLDELS